MEGAHDIVVAVEEEFGIACKCDFGTTKFWQKHGVTDFDGNWTQISLFGLPAGASCHNNTVVKLVSLGTGEDDSCLGLSLSCGLLHHNAIEQRLQSLECEHK